MRVHLRGARLVARQHAGVLGDFMRSHKYINHLFFFLIDLYLLLLLLTPQNCGFHSSFSRASCWPSAAALWPALISRDNFVYVLLVGWWLSSGVFLPPNCYQNHRQMTFIALQQKRQYWTTLASSGRFDSQVRKTMRFGPQNGHSTTWRRSAYIQKRKSWTQMPKFDQS